MSDLGSMINNCLASRGHYQMNTMQLSAVLNQEGDGYVSLCTELDIATRVLQLMRLYPILRKL
jgi:hypothetical protein